MEVKQTLIPTGKEYQDFEMMRSFAPGEREIITKCLERAWRAKHDEVRR